MLIDVVGHLTKKMFKLVILPQFPPCVDSHHVAVRGTLSHVVIISPPLGVKLVERDMNNPFPRVNRPFLRVISQHGEQVSHIFSLILTSFSSQLVSLSVGPEYLANNLANDVQKIDNMY